jgi:hypothetical protein
VDLGTQLITDCSGTVTHRLSLRLDGTVEIVDGRGNRAIVEPRLRTCLTPGAHVAPYVMDAAASLINVG